jgi:NTE family protein
MYIGALIFQGGGSLGAYEAGAYKAISEEMSTFIKKRYREKKEEEPTLFHIVSGTSIGAINAAILVSYVKKIKHGKVLVKDSLIFGNIFLHTQMLRI